MPDDRGTRAVQDRARINVGEDYEVEYWAKALGVSKGRLIEAIAKVGDSVRAIRKEVSSS
jgi:hypothetical protein